MMVYAFYDIVHTYTLNITYITDTIMRFLSCCTMYDLLMAAQVPRMHRDTRPA